MAGSLPFVPPFVSRRSFDSPSANGACSESITPAPVPQNRDQFKPGPARSRISNVGPGQSHMEHLLRLQAGHPRSSQIPHYDYPHTIPYQPVMSSQSYLRSSATHALPTPIPHAQPFPRDSPVSSYSSSGFHAGSPTMETTFSYPMESDFDSAVAAAGGHYGGGEQGNEHLWAYQERPAHADFYGGAAYHSQDALPGGADDPHGILSRYLKQEEPSGVNLADLSSHYFPADTADNPLCYSMLHAGHDPSAMATDFGYGFDPSVHAQSYNGNGNAGGGSPSFTLTSDPHLQYPPPTDAVPRFVSPAQIAPGMGAGPPLLALDSNETAGLDPRYTVGSPALFSEGPLGSQDSGYGPAPFPRASPSNTEQAGALPRVGRPPKRRRAESFTSSSSSEEYMESERDTDDGMDDDNDDDYVQGGARPRTRRRTVSSASSSSRTDMPVRRTAPPVPVPNLTKKSRGRRVPTASSVLDEDLAEKARRTYMCEVDGCGKCFARGEHLKRHVRSIHTNDKPHKCPVPGCGKDFSRHDNLGQHMRVHRDWSAKQRRLAGPA